jgi:hypothetical protein
VQGVLQIDRKAMILEQVGKGFIRIPERSHPVTAKLRQFVERASSQAISLRMARSDSPVGQAQK